MPKKKRGPGEGAVYQRADGKWCSSVDLGIVNGKRKRKVVYGATRREVLEKLKQLHLQQAQGIDIAPERITVAEFLGHWLEHVIKPNRRPRTYKSYKDVTVRHVIPFVGRYQLSKLEPIHVQYMVTELVKSGRTRTPGYARSVLSRALNRAVKWDLVRRNVASLTDAPPSSSQEIVPLTEEQARRLLDAVRGHRLEALYRVALSLGLRRGEVLALRWEDIDFSKATLRVTGALQWVDGKLVRTPTKTKRSNRTLPLPSILKRALLHHRQLQEEERRRLGNLWQENGLVFPSEIGTPLNPYNLIRHFKLMLKKAGLPTTVRFHDLRHSAATLLLAQGVPLKVVSDLLGHSSIVITADVYGHVVEEAQRAAADKLDTLLGEKEDEEGEK